MAYRHRLQSSRFELKYIVDEAKASAIRQFIGSYLEPDEFTTSEEGYLVQSLYLDTSSLFLCNQTVEGIKNRFKLRIRFYDDNPDSPAFLEIKRRVVDVICKERAAMSREGVRQMLLEGHADPSHLLGGDSKSVSALGQFYRLRDSIRAVPNMYVTYFREAYVSPNSDQLRVTFDRNLDGVPYTPGTGLELLSHGARPDPGGVVLELKFTDRFPGWMRELVHAFNLRRTSVPKYCLCIEVNGMGRKPFPGARVGLSL